MRRDPTRNRQRGIGLLVLVVGVLFSVPARGQVARFIEVPNPRKLSVDKIACQRIPLGKADD